MYNHSTSSQVTCDTRGSLNAIYGSGSTAQRRVSANVATSPYGHAAVNSAGGNVKSERVLNSTILREEWFSGFPEQDHIKYVEIPVVEEVIRHVPRREYVEVERKVPRYEVEYIERIVDVPQIHFVDKHVDVSLYISNPLSFQVPKIQEVYRHVPVKQIIDVPREVLKYVPKIETKIVEKEVEVPGQVIEIPKPYVVDNKIIVPRYVDQDLTCVVAQSLHPVITESSTDFVDVEMREFTPYLVPVDVMVPRPVARQLMARQKTEEHRIVDIPVAHFNALLKSVNPGLSDLDLESKYVVVNGITPIATNIKFATITSPENTPE